MWYLDWLNAVFGFLMKFLYELNILGFKLMELNAAC